VRAVGDWLAKVPRRAHRRKLRRRVCQAIPAPAPSDR